MNHQNLIKQLSLEEKAGLVSGQDFWHTRAIDRLGIPAVEMTDGPHGVRKMRDMQGENTFADPVATTAYPTASLSACSFDRELLKTMGKALAEECRRVSVGLLLGPGANIKRSPLCGRNFEYFSEDPLLSGTMAGAWIEGLQERRIGASLKHYAVNNQEKRRMSVDAVVEPRALHEIYLASFEEAIRTSQPASVMCAYNKVNGSLCSENQYLNTKVLRETWGFEGFVVTDWGATRDRVQGLLAGIDLAMPSSGPTVQAAIVKAVQNGSLPEATLDASVGRLLDFVLATAPSLTAGTPPDGQATPTENTESAADHQALSLRIAEEASVLVKNDHNTLPLDPAQAVCVIGSLAETPRYQGAGSSYLAPARTSSFVGAVRELGIQLDYAAGYRYDSDSNDTELEAAALALAQRAVAAGRPIIYYLGLPDAYESEGFDRQHLRLPANQTGLLAKIAKHGGSAARIVAVFVGGSPVETGWIDQVQALLLGYLGGQHSGMAQARLLFGLAMPCGKLAESWPHRLEDNPSHGNFPGTDSQVLYKEGCFVGYRYYASRGLPVRFAFGQGLSYTSFRYNSLEFLPTGSQPDSRQVTAQDILANRVLVRVSLTNTGGRDCKEAIQVYASLPDSELERPVIALAGFAKVFVKAGETRIADIAISALAVRYWDETAQHFAVENGRLLLRAGPSSVELPLTLELQICGAPEVPSNLRQIARRNLAATPAAISDSEFSRYFGGKLPSPPPLRPFTADSTFGDLAAHSLFARLVLKVVTGQFLKGLGAPKDSPNYRMVVEMIHDMPLSRLESLSRGRFHRGIVNALVLIANGRVAAGLSSLLGLPGKA